MQPIIFLVTLDKTQHPPVLDVFQKNGVNEVDRNTNQQEIEWQLAGNAKKGFFLDPGNPTARGFEWLGTTPKDGVFSDAKKAPRWRLTMTDLHDSASSAGRYDYRLRAVVDGVEYQSGSAAAGRPTDPAIINK